jgi:sugar lactone lactonase YvrE
VWRLGQDGACAPFLREVDGMRLGSTNFVGVDPKGRIWAAVSTRREPRQRAYRGDVADGYIVLVDGDGARIVADEIGYTNESIVDPSGEWLIVNETFARHAGRRHSPGPWVRHHARRGSGRRSRCAVLST